MYTITKRLIDLFISVLAFILCLPLFLPITIALRLTAEGEVFYFQKRIGLNKKYFHIWKFATMLKNSPNMGSGEITLRNDPRVTAIGKYLRISKLNELPQIINVIKGDMSIVGPRPLVDKTFYAYEKEVQEKVYLSKPGITGIGSIVFRDEEHLISNSTMPPHEFYKSNIAPYKGALELWYLKNKSIIVDFLLILLTVWVIIFKQTDLPYKVFKDLPEKPDFLAIA